MRRSSWVWVLIVALLSLIWWVALESRWTRDRRLAEQRAAPSTYTASEADKAGQAVAGGGPAIASATAAAVASWSPPPISVDIKDAALSDVAIALTNATGVPITSTGGSPDHFTLAAANAPFWDVFMQLSRQHDIALNSDTFKGVTGPTANLQLLPAASPLHDMARSSDFLFFINDLTVIKTANPQAKPGAERSEQIILRYTMTCDPRLTVLRASFDPLKNITDDHGNKLTSSNPKNSSRPLFWSNEVSLEGPANLGDKIKSAEGTAKVITTGLMEKTDLVDPDKHVEQALELPAGNFFVGRFETSPGSVVFNLRQERAKSGPASSINVPMQAALIDGAGTTLWSGQVTSVTPGEFKGAYTAPLKFQITAPSKIQEVTVPFEFKDIVLP